MFGRKFLLAAAAYITGSVVTTIFNSKKGDKVREDLKKAKEKGNDTKNIIVANFIDTHKNFLEDLKERFVTEDNKKIINKKIDEAKDLIQDYKNQGEKLIDELKEKGSDYLDTAKENLEELYNEKKEDIEKIKADAPKKMEKAKEKLLAKFDEVKDKITK